MKEVVYPVPLGLVQLFVVEQENSIVFEAYAEMVEVVVLLGFQQS